MGGGGFWRVGGRAPDKQKKNSNSCLLFNLQPSDPACL